MPRSRGHARRSALLGSWAWAVFVLLELLVPAPHRALFAQTSVALVIAFALRTGFRPGLAMGVAGGAIHLSLFAIGELPLAVHNELAALLAAVSMLVVSGAVVGLLSDRTKAQLSRRHESEERYALAARGANDGLWDWDLKTDRVFYSERWRDILGYRIEQVTETPSDWLDRIHPDDVESVRADVRAHLEGSTERYENEHRIRRCDGRWTWVLTRGLVTRDASGRPRRMAGWLTDISRRKDDEQRLRHYAFHDALTGLANRALWMDRVEHAIARARERPGGRFAVVLLDLDRFKNVNDSLGHLAGDELLVQVADRLLAAVDESDTVARLGGDEFVVLLEDLDTDEDAERAANRLSRALLAPMVIEGHDVTASASMGLVISEGILDARTLLKRADRAMYEAKRRGRGRTERYVPALSRNGESELALESALRSALSERTLVLHLQPIVALRGGAIRGFEALCRFSHPKLGYLPPETFLPVADEAALSEELGTFVLEEACRALEDLSRLVPAETELTMSVNLSAREVCDHELSQRVKRTLDRFDLAPHRLVLEVTENALMQDAAAGLGALQALRKSGVRVHLDDFGTGYSSLSYLHRFQLDALKIDASFTGQLHDETGGAEDIVRSVLTIAHELGLSVIAEGVERAEQLDRLRALGCEAAQGFFIAPPMTLAEARRLLRDKRTLVES